MIINNKKNKYIKNNNNIVTIPNINYVLDACQAFAENFTCS